MSTLPNTSFRALGAAGARAIAALALAACRGDAPTPSDATAGPGALRDLAPEAATIPAATAQAEADAAAAKRASKLPATLPGRVDGCPDGMVRVEGEYCPALMQDCVEHHKEFANAKGNKNVSERCLRYRSPSKCVVKKRVHLSFCMDRFEYPNQEGAIPKILVSWRQAVATCAKEGKRICNEAEFNFACEGPEMLPYANGFVRDDKACNIDREYRFPDHSRALAHHDECMKTPWCKAEVERLDQREPSGSRPSCVSWAGVYDINGNVNEWVRRPREESPNRSGLKGGWWGPVRSRCRPTVTFHKEEDYGYEVGFRCCKDVEGPANAAADAKGSKRAKAGKTAQSAKASAPTKPAAASPNEAPPKG